MKIFLIPFIAIALLSSCTSNNDFDKGVKDLELRGYTNIKNTGYKPWCCSDEDTFSTGFKAISKDGETVEGCFCSDYMKGVTIRFK